MPERTRPPNDSIQALEGISRDTVFEHSGAANMVVASDTTLLAVNGRFEELTGYSKEEVEGKMSWTKLVHPDDLERMTEIHRMRRENPSLVPASYEYRFLTINGDIRWGLLTGATLANGSRSLISVVDVTLLKEKEATLSRTERFYKNIVHTQTELIIRFTPDLVLTFVNDAYCRFYGESRESLIGRTFTHHVLPEDIEEQRNYFSGITPENPIQEIEERTKVSSGEIRWQHWTDKGIFDEAGILVEIQSSGRDITDLHRTREKLDDTIEKLRHSFGLSIEMAGKIIEVRDPFTAGHQRRVARLAKAIAAEMGLDRDQIIATELASLAHDVGKIQVPSEILSKPGVLHAAEWAIIRQHPI